VLESREESDPVVAGRR